MLKKTSDKLLLFVELSVIIKFSIKKPAITAGIFPLRRAGDKYLWVHGNLKGEGGGGDI